MTDRELMQMALDNLESLVAYIQGGEPDLVMQVPAIEALRVALAAKEPEPVMWLYHDASSFDELLYAKNKGFPDYSVMLSINKRQGHQNETPLYTAPPQREWQRLTDAEILEEYRQSYGDDGNLTDVYFARAIEIKLREKNSA